jgi:hypothetical protein
MTESVLGTMLVLNGWALWLLSANCVQGIGPGMEGDTRTNSLSSGNFGTGLITQGCRRVSFDPQGFTFYTNINKLATIYIFFKVCVCVCVCVCVSVSVCSLQRKKTGNCSGFQIGNWGPGVNSLMLYNF